MTTLLNPSTFILFPVISNNHFFNYFYNEIREDLYYFPTYLYRLSNSINIKKRTKFVQNPNICVME